MKRNKIIVALAALLAIAAVTTLAKPKTKAAANSRLKIVVTIFPEYDWVKHLLGDEAQNTDVTLLLDNGVDLHSYQPTVQDMARISAADIFIYIGGESDGWVTDALKNARNKDRTVINLLAALGDRAKEEELVEGMQAEDEEEDDETEFDEHVWLSLRNARFLCAVITDALCTQDAAHASTYRANLAAYTQELAALDARYEAAVTSARTKTLVFGDRFPFRYLMDDYGLRYYAAFAGCSTETEASFKTVAFLAEKLDELNAQHVLCIEGSDGKIARTIIQNSKNKKATVLTMDSMQSTTARDIKKGASYIGIMQKNLTVLTEALGSGNAG